MCFDQAEAMKADCDLMIEVGWTYIDLSPEGFGL